jgi:hypothetical protein
MLQKAVKFDLSEFFRNTYFFMAITDREKQDVTTHPLDLKILEGSFEFFHHFQSVSRGLSLPLGAKKKRRRLHRGVFMLDGA